MLKRIFYLSLTLTAFLTAAYWFQPTKKGKGTNANTRYEPQNEWLHLPAGFKLGNPSGISIDTNQNIVVFHRANREWPLFGGMPETPIEGNTILIINKDNGQLIKSWGDRLFVMPHGLHIDRQNNIWLTDVGLHQVFKFTHDGKLLMKLGEAKVAGNDSLHFDQPTDVAVANDGSFYVTDGYGNSRVIKFSPGGKYLFQWGTKGYQPGQFNIPHSISLDDAGNVYIADRENNRIQKFDPNGRFITAYSNKNFGAICAVMFNQEDSKIYAADDVSFLKLKHRGSDVLILDTAGNIETRFGRSSIQHLPVSWYHDIAIDKQENIYVADILNNTIQKFKKVSN